MASGPCLCGDPYCAFCGDPQAAAMEEWLDHLCEITADFTEQEARIFEAAGMKAVELERELVEYRRTSWKEWFDDEPRTRPIQGGWLEKDTLTGEVHEPLTRRKEDWE